MLIIKIRGEGREANPRPRWEWHHESRAFRYWRANVVVTGGHITYALITPLIISMDILHIHLIINPKIIWLTTTVHVHVYSILGLFINPQTEDRHKAFNWTKMSTSNLIPKAIRKIDASHSIFFKISLHCPPESIPTNQKYVNDYDIWVQISILNKIWREDKSIVKPNDTDTVVKWSGAAALLLRLKLQNEFMLQFQ